MQDQEYSKVVYKKEKIFLRGGEGEWLLKK